MRYCIIPILLLISINDFAQNYSLVAPGRTSWYETSIIMSGPYDYFCYNDTCLVAVKIDSSFYSGDTIAHYLNRMIGYKDGDMYERCEHESIFGDRSILTDSVQIIIRNSDILTTTLSDSFFIYTNKSVGEEWLFNSTSDDLFFYASISSKSEEDILGEVDSVITITFNTKNLAGENIEHPFDGKKIKLSKNTGAIVFYDLHYFPSDTSAKKLTGLTEPNAGTLPPDKNKIFDFEPGDEFHYISSYHSNFSFANTYSEMSKIIVSKTVSANTDTIFYETRRSFYQTSWSGTYSDIRDTICYYDSLITEKYILSQYGFLDTLSFNILNAGSLGFGYSKICFEFPFGFVTEIPMYYIPIEPEGQCMNSLIGTGIYPVRS